MNSLLLSERDAAKKLGVPQTTLRSLRRSGDLVEFVPLGRSAYYTLDHLESLIERLTCKPNSVSDNFGSANRPASAEPISRHGKTVARPEEGVSAPVIFRRRKKD